MALSFEELCQAADNVSTAQVSGRVKEVVGLVVHASSMVAPIGSICEIITVNGKTIPAGIVGFKGDVTLLMSYGDLEGISQNDKVTVTETEQFVTVGDHLLGGVYDGLGKPFDKKKTFKSAKKISLNTSPPNPLDRPTIRSPLALGVRAIDSFLAIGKGQRVGIFAGTGVGKSVTLGMISRNTAADVVVICLVGERGREVREFLEEELGSEGMKKAVVVISTSDRPALERVKSVFVATSIAEYFRDQGKDVLLLMDSITRVAMAQREIGLSAGEPPTTKGYPPSVFNLFPKFLERAGCNNKGSITGIYTVLVEGDDINDPIGDTVRGILDGHILLSRDLAIKGHYPAIDVLGSISRVMPMISDEKILKAAISLRSLLAAYTEAEDLINIGAYVKGSNPKVDKAIEMNDSINKLLQQGMKEKAPINETLKRLQSLAAMANIK